MPEVPKKVVPAKKIPEPVPKKVEPPTPPVAKGTLTNIEKESLWQQHDLFLCCANDRAKQTTSPFFSPPSMLELY